MFGAVLCYVDAVGSFCDKTKLSCRPFEMIIKEVEIEIERDKVLEVLFNKILRAELNECSLFEMLVSPLFFFCLKEVLRLRLFLIESTSFSLCLVGSLTLPERKRRLVFVLAHPVNCFRMLILPSPPVRVQSNKHRSLVSYKN
jgi:hypothetical protein